MDSGFLVDFDYARKLPCERGLVTWGNIELSFELYNGLDWFVEEHCLRALSLLQLSCPRVRMKGARRDDES
jgi:hypothetical protein